MKEVRRYDWDCIGMSEQKSGDYVLVEAYDALLVELKQLQEKVGSVASISLAEAVVSELINCGAENYKESTVEITFDDGTDSVDAVVILQRIGKPTAHMMRLEAESKRDELMAALTHISDLCKMYVDSGDSMHSASIEKLMDFADEAMSGDLGGDV